jgi:hypothetical protein
MGWMTHWSGLFFIPENRRALSLPIPESRNSAADRAEGPIEDERGPPKNQGVRFSTLPSAVLTILPRGWPVETLITVTTSPCLS